MNVHNPSPSSKLPQQNLPPGISNSPKVSSPPKLPWASQILSGLEGILNGFIDRPRGPWVDPKKVLSSNSAPVDELEPTECKVEGELPTCLEGAYIRNGPNPQLMPEGPYHMFDGDGMLHCLRITDGRVTFCSRYVQTYKYINEKKAGMRLVPNFMAEFQSLIPSLARVSIYLTRMREWNYDKSKGYGTANTNLALIGGRLYALGESDQPYEIEVTPSGDIKTVGRCNLNGKLSTSMTAHPKTNVDTGETFAFTNTLIPPHLTYFWFDQDGNKQPDVPIPWMNGPSFLHDFAVTNKYAIFPDIQLRMDLLGFITGTGSLAAADSEKLSKIWITDCYANDSKDIRSFTVPGFNTLHIANAWDETDDKGDEYVVLVAPNISPVDQMQKALDTVRSRMERLKINLKTGKCSWQPLSSSNVELPVINPAYQGKKNKYIYAGVFDPAPKIVGVVKLDLTKAGRDDWECTTASRMYSPGTYGSETYFIARDPKNKEAEEDDGYLVSYVHSEKTGESKFIVMDARSPTLDIVASVKLPQRVPYGFHGIFVRETDLKRLQDHGFQNRRN
ncbi:putative carotenoid cleavage dioxygenase 4, chloroplastic [Drosera capensis]